MDLFPGKMFCLVRTNENLVEFTVNEEIDGGGNVSYNTK